MDPRVFMKMSVRAWVSKLVGTVSICVNMQPRATLETRVTQKNRC